MNSVIRLIHAKPRLLMSIIEISTIGRAVKLEDGMRADQEATRRFHQRRSSAVETPTVLRLLASGFGFRPHRSAWNRSIHPKAHVFGYEGIQTSLRPANIIIPRSLVSCYS